MPKAGLFELSLSFFSEFNQRLVKQLYQFAGNVAYVTPRFYTAGKIRSEKKQSLRIVRVVQLVLAIVYIQVDAFP